MSKLWRAIERKLTGKRQCNICVLKMFTLRASHRIGRLVGGIYPGGMKKNQQKPFEIIHTNMNYNQNIGNGNIEQVSYSREI